MSINIDQISAIIKDQIKKYDDKTSYQEVGHVISISDGIALINGLETIMNGEIVSFSKNLEGMALDLEENTIGVIILGDYSHVKEGDKVSKTGKLISVPVGNQLTGRIVDALGRPIDGGSKITSKKFRPIEKVAPGIMVRKSVNKPLETGILAIDSTIPIGKGQRELIIGDRQTGKTAVALDTIINQIGKSVKCIYVAIGQKNSTIVNFAEKLREHKAMAHTTIVAANASASDALQYIAPYSAMAIAEEWMENGEDVLIVFDDLSKHAVAYRAISLLLRRPPGREAYPGDVFYLHSKLLERAAKLNDKNGGGSITALPIIETQTGDISAYIPTNVISITDGQIFLKTDAFNSGIRPAVDSGLSVSRVGGAAQIKSMKQTSGSLKLSIAQFQEVESFSQFGSDLDESTKRTLDEGQRIREILKQKQYIPIDQVDQTIILFAIKEKLIMDVPIKKVINFRNELISYFLKDKTAKELRKKLNSSKDITEDISKQLKDIINKFKILFITTK